MSQWVNFGASNKIVVWLMVVLCVYYFVRVVLMDDNSLLRNSSVCVAYMGSLGWGSAYFYGWGISFYYGFPWWVVGAGVDDIARSLFHAVTVMATLFIGWGIGIIFFLGVKQRSNVHDLSFFRLFLAIWLLFVPVIIEFSVLKRHLAANLFISSLVAVLVLSVIIRFYGERFSFSFFVQNTFIKRHFLEVVMIGFVVYFWVFSFLVGYYKPQFKKEYEMIHHNNSWYYVLARYDSNLVLSKSFKAGNGRFLVFRTEQYDNYEFNIVQTRL
jgi:hypothetical protein